MTPREKPLWRSLLDGAAALAMLVASAVLIWVSLSNRASPFTDTANDEVPAEPLSLAGAVVRGDAHAPLAIIEYSDFSCPFCRQFATQTLTSLEERYIRPGRVLFAYRPLPLESLHPLALRAAQAAECANRQGRFWEMHDRLLQNDRTAAGGDFVEHARSLGLNAETFTECFAKDEVSNAIRRDVAEAKKLRITGTPTFLVGVVLPDGRVRIRRRLFGARSLQDFADVIEPLLIRQPAARNR
jgi:protein-disulfide isomerase